MNQEIMYYASICEEYGITESAFNDFLYNDYLTEASEAELDARYKDYAKKAKFNGKVVLPKEDWIARRSKIKKGIAAGIGAAAVVAGGAAAYKNRDKIAMYATKEGRKELARQKKVTFNDERRAKKKADKEQKRKDAEYARSKEGRTEKAIRRKNALRKAEHDYDKTEYSRDVERRNMRIKDTQDMEEFKHRGLTDPGHPEESAYTSKDEKGKNVFDKAGFDAHKARKKAHDDEVDAREKTWKDNSYPTKYTHAPDSPKPKSRLRRGMERFWYGKELNEAYSFDEDLDMLFNEAFEALNYEDDSEYDCFDDTDYDLF